MYKGGNWRHCRRRQRFNIYSCSGLFRTFHSLNNMIGNRIIPNGFTRLECTRKNKWVHIFLHFLLFNKSKKKNPFFHFFASFSFSLSQRYKDEFFFYSLFELSVPFATAFFFAVGVSTDSIKVYKSCVVNGSITVE